MDSATVLVPNPVAVLREEFDDWAVLFNPDTADVLGLNPVGVAVWKLLDGSRSVAQLVAGVRDAFDEVPDTVDAEVHGFLATLQGQGFLGREVVPGA